MTRLHGFGTCACCGDLLAARLDRRHMLRMAGGIGLLAALQPFTAFAQEGKYEAMVLGCIDPRLQVPVTAYLTGRELTGRYSHFIFAGAAVGVVADAFKDWHKTFWDNLAATIELHDIKKVIAINHRDCGAARIAYGADAVATRDKETATHRAALAEFRKQVGQRHANLGVETGLMAIDGTIEMFG